MSPRDATDIQMLQVVSGCPVCLVVRSHSVDFLDLQTFDIIHTFQTEAIQHRTLRYLRSSSRVGRCGSPGLASFTLVYVNPVTGECVLQTYVPSVEGDTICFCNPARPRTASCLLWAQARELKRNVNNPGSWEALHNGSVVGIRKSNDEADHSATRSPLQNGLRQRLRQSEKANHNSTNSHDRNETWEVWVMSQLDADHRIETRPLISPTEETARNDSREGVPGHLMISRLGPLTRIGVGSVGVGFGHVIKVVTVGQQRFGDDDEGGASGADRHTPDILGGPTNRRRRGGGPPRSRAPAPASPWPAQMGGGHSHAWAAVGRGTS
jgi:hypothetical protein